MTIQVLYPGVNTIVGARFTLSRGAMPSVGTITMVPQDNFFVAPQTMTWQSDQGTLQFPGCILDIANLRRKWVEGTWRWDVKVYDRRLAWWSYTLDANYNQRLTDGSLKLDTKKSAREIAQAILTKFGETANVDGMPDNVFPRCDWKGVNAAAALQWLCEYCSCAIGFTNSNQVQLVAYGEGADLPTTLKVNPQFRFTSGKSPQKLEAVSGPTVYQNQLVLQPVMLKSDDYTLEHVDASDFEPSEGWDTEPWTNFGNVDNQHRDHAEDDFCRRFYVYSQKDGTQNVPGSTTAVTSIQQILPLLPHLASQMTLGDEALALGKLPQSPYLIGNYWPLCDIPINLEDKRWTGIFTVDGATGFVKTEYPVFTMENTDQEQVEFKLHLTAAFHVRSSDGELDRLKETENVGGVAGTKVLVRPEVFGAYINGDIVEETREQAKLELRAYLTQFAKRYQTAALKCDIVELAGYHPCPLDGKIAQITLHYGYSGTPAMTVSTGYEHDIYNESFEESLRKATLLRLSEGAER